MKATFLAMRLSISQKSFIFLITRFRQAMKTMFRLFFLGVVVIFPFAAEAQLLSVSGYVKNYISGQPIENVTIYETNSGIGTITNSDGFYRLLLQSGEQQLKISSAGFEDFKTTFASNAINGLIASFAGEAVIRLPTTVPRFRIWGEPISQHACSKQKAFSRIRGEAMTWLWVTRGPI